MEGLKEKLRDQKLLKQLLLYIAGVQVLACGMMLMVRCNLGVSVGTSAYYVLSQRFTVISLGVWNYITHGTVLMIMMIILRKVRLFYLLSFLTSMFLGYSLDFYGFLLPAGFGNMALRLVLLCVGITGVALGIALIYASGFPPAPFDTFSKEISRHFRWKIGVVKTAFDVTYLALAFALGFLFFGKVVGIGVGTVISAFTTGTLVAFFKKTLEQLHLTVEREE